MKRKIAILGSTGSIGKSLLDIIAKDNSIIVGSEDYLNVKKLYLRDTNLLSDTNTFKKDIFIKVRSTGKLLKAKANFKKNFGEIEILQDERGVSPGQACVFYSKDEIGERVLGGGWIDKTVKKIYPHNSQSIKKTTKK